MTPRQFFDIVEQMRAAQIDYFKTRNFYALTKSKALERQVDEEIERVHRVVSEPTIKFDGDAND